MAVLKLLKTVQYNDVNGEKYCGYIQSKALTPYAPQCSAQSEAHK